ncbi:uncharacterized protein F5Z01DRAFT_662018 [Emericellopsis atlantica]|uniref:Uncharacterized protein n=1 Tax=Emericellopsis atlantica TaxID=2614577 RepID=A0A9P8CLY9_9HYPO|nr:uncharacterized protein F5Z01DRAFT_662018 [Emericellopsis atlantica]KAG9252119.1 hypothetical protein F5Z01DRAFT_662018 [Emericellopsis atlantica]
MVSNTESQLSALLRSPRFKEAFLPCLSPSDLCALRTTSKTNSALLTKDIFTRVHVSFTAHSFTKQSRLNALARIGGHVEHLTFHFPHSEATFLPPLIHPQSGKEIHFLYTPHTSMTSCLTRPKYANSELGDILTAQYPPLFHSATNVPSFIHALKVLPNMRHLTVRCPGQDKRERYRRNIVDYALISLRIAIERAPLEKLHKLSLSSLHPSALNYLRHVPGFGSLPSSGRRWRQITKLNMSMEAWEFHSSSPGLDHLKILDDYIRHLAPQLEKLSFTWLGPKGPCPIALSADPLFASAKSFKKLFHEVTSPMSPLPARPTRKDMFFPKLKYLQIRNASMQAEKLRDVIERHRDNVREFDFREVVLLNKGDWDDALSPLEDGWSRRSMSVHSSERSGYTESTVVDDDYSDLPSPSAAVEAASRELMDIAGFSDEERSTLSFGTTASDMEPVREEGEETEGVSTNVRRRRRRRRRHHVEEEETIHRSKISLSSLSFRSKSSQPKLRPSQSSLKSQKPRHQPSEASLQSVRPRPPSPIVDTAITLPILNNGSQPVLLQPTVYNPAAPGEEDISPVQRNMEQEAQHALLAQDASARCSALRKAKAAVLQKLSREFCANAAKRTYGGGSAVAACRMMTNHNEPRSCAVEVLEDRRGLDRGGSIMVPLMFSRA